MIDHSEGVSQSYVEYIRESHIDNVITESLYEHAKNKKRSEEPLLMGCGGGGMGLDLF